jgi:hypothetical protein
MNDLEGVDVEHLFEVAGARRQIGKVDGTGGIGGVDADGPIGSPEAEIHA